MTERVDFYVLNSPTPKQRWTFACRLTEKAYLRELRVVVLSASAEEAKALDDLLWTFNDRSLRAARAVRRGAPPTRHAGAADDRLDVAPAADLLVNLATAAAQRERFAESPKSSTPTSAAPRPRALQGLPRAAHPAETHQRRDRRAGRHDANRTIRAKFRS